MRRLILLAVLVASVFVTGCEDTEDNSPALQGQMDDFFYKAVDIRAEKNEDGTYTIQGITRDETLTLHLRSGQLLTYPLGGGNRSFATYEDAAGNSYTTTPNGWGEIVLTDRCISCGWLTGTFKFTAIQEGVDTITVEKGFFYEANFLQGQLAADVPVATDGSMEARLDETNFEANNVSAELANQSIIINGFTSERVIRIEFPFDAVPGNYGLGTEGYSATLISNGVEDPAVSGLITINFNNTASRKARLFFSFVTESGAEITSGDTRVDY